MYHSSNWFMGMGAKRIVLVSSHTRIGGMRPCSHIGTMSTGFQAMAPKTTGSLILTMAGGRQALPSALSRVDLEAAIMSTRAMVLPMPPNQR